MRGREAHAKLGRPSSGKLNSHAPRNAFHPAIGVGAITPLSLAICTACDHTNPRNVALRSAYQGSTPRVHTSRSFYFTHGRSATTAVVSPRHCAPIESNDGSFDVRIGTLPLPEVSGVLVLLSMARRKSGLARHERSARR